MENTKTELLNARQVAEILGVTPWTVYDLAYKRRIPYVKLGVKMMRFDINEIKKFINRQTVKPIL